MATFATTYDEKIRPLMDKIDQARVLLAPNSYGINFPNVIVVGDQSSGKSSLLESLSMVELPKGNGIVTRCPLVLRLRKSDERRLYRLYEQGESNRKVLLDETNLVIPQYIEEETKKLAGEHKNVVKDIIELQVEDPNVRDLTVVDLPGIAHNPIADQPEDIYDQTVNLIRQFTEQEGSVILCVFPANVDIATVQSFKLAREVDPLGKRTIGVITKSDLAPDKEMLVQQLLMDRPDVLHLKLGFVAVRNRSTKENISLQEAHEKETEFFKGHPASSAAGWNCIGINALINRLATVYSERVKETFPKLRKDIQIRLKDVTEQLSKLPPQLKTNTERVAVYNEIVDLYIEKILKPPLMGSNDGRHGTMVNILHQKFETYRITLRQQRAELFSTEYCSKIEEEMKESAGEQLPNFLSSAILKKCINAKLDQLWDETEKLINDCFRMTIIQLRKSEDNASKNNFLLSKLIGLFRDISVSLIKEKREWVYNQLKDLIDLDKNEPYTNNTAYMYIFEKYKGSLSDKNTAPPKPSFGMVTTTNSTNGFGDDDDDVLTYKQGSSDAQAVKQMLLSIYSYWKFLTKRFIDYTTLSLRAGCVFTICAVVQQRLRRIPIEHLDLIEKYLSDDDFTQNKRKQCQKTRETLEKVYNILHEDDILAVDEFYIDITETQNNSLTTPTSTSNIVSQSPISSAPTTLFQYTAPTTQSPFTFSPTPAPSSFATPAVSSTFGTNFTSGGFSFGGSKK